MHRIDRPRQVLAICLASLAGFVDATGFLASRGYFVSFMSGNTTRLAVDLAQEPHRALAPLGLIGGFVTGVVAGAVLAGVSGERRKPAVLALVTTLLGLAALAARAGMNAPALGATVLAMGALNNTFQRDGEVSVGLTYMTGALVRLGQGVAARLLGRPGGTAGAHLLLWLGLAGGALVGAHAFLHLGRVCLWIAFGWALLLCLAARAIAAREPA